MLSTEEMNWEVVQGFLNVSGIKGVALIDGQSRPCFQGIEEVLSNEQRDALAQGVWQILETIPENFDAFEFQFLGTQVYIHKINPELILLVLTHDSVLYPDYCEAFVRLKAEFEADRQATLRSFRKLLATRTPTLVPGGEAIAQAMVQEIAEQNGQGGAVFTTAPKIAVPPSPLPATAVPPLRPIQLAAPEPDVQPAVPRRPELEDTLHDLFPEEETSGSRPQPAPNLTPSDKRPLTNVQSAAPPQQPPMTPRQPLVATAQPPTGGQAPGRDKAKVAENPFARGMAGVSGSMAAPPDAIAQETFVDLSEIEPVRGGDRPNPTAQNGLSAIARPETALPNIDRPNLEGAAVELPDIGLFADSHPQTAAQPVFQSQAIPQAVPQATHQDIPQSTPQFQHPSQLSSSVSEQLLTDWLAALNCLGQCAIHYLGRAVVANYWRASRPNSDWVGRFEIERSGQIQPHRDFALAHAATPQQQAVLRDWAERFAERCGRVIRDFPQLAETQGLSPEQRQLLGI